MSILNTRLQSTCLPPQDCLGDAGHPCQQDRRGRAAPMYQPAPPWQHGSWLRLLATNQHENYQKRGENASVGEVSANASTSSKQSCAVPQAQAAQPSLCDHCSVARPSISPPSMVAILKARHTLKRQYPTCAGPQVSETQACKLGCAAAGAGCAALRRAAALLGSPRCPGIHLCIRTLLPYTANRRSRSPASSKFELQSRGAPPMTAFKQMAVSRVGPAARLQPAR